MDPEALAHAEGIAVIAEGIEDKDVSGLLYRRPDRSVILVNSEHHPRRRRFTIAHELGHYFLHANDTYLDAGPAVHLRDGLAATGTDLEERQANSFAACLLMPEPWVRAHLIALRSEGVFGEDAAVARLAAMFDVSDQAMRFRLMNLGLSVYFGADEET